MTLYQKIPTTSARIDPMTIVAVGGVILLSLVATAAIVRWLPDAGHIGHASAASRMPGGSNNAASASASATAELPAGRSARKLHPQNSQARVTQLASA